jgi:phosphatidylglycerol:prolipoprotein diacylglycerol transferase
VHPVLFHLGPILIPSYGALAALGVLAALFLAQQTARIAGLPMARIWNLCVVGLFAALVGGRVLLIVVNLSDLRRHPAWLLQLAMVHNPLLAVAGALAGGLAAGAYALAQKLPLRSTADVLAAPLAVGLAFEQFGALLAGSGYGVEATGWAAYWSVTYTDSRSGLWSGTPLGIPLHPVQAYAALAFLALTGALLVWLPVRRRPGDVAGVGLMAAAVLVYVTEFWRDPEGRGALLSGAIDLPQLAAVGMVLAGALLLLEWKSRQVRNEAVNGSKAS